MAKTAVPHQKLLSLPTTTMMECFGDGRPSPGSGSAAAFVGAFACYMIQGYAALSAGRLKKERFRVAQCVFIAETIANKHRPVLTELIEQDRDTWDEVVALRRKRDKSKKKTDKERFSRKHKAKLKSATELILQIANESLSAARLGVQIFDVGYKAARGEAAAAVNFALAASQTGLNVALLNLSRFREGKWAKSLHAKCMALSEAIKKVQDSFLQMAAVFRDEADDAILGPVGQSTLLGLLGPESMKIRAASSMASGSRRIRRTA